MKIYMSVHIEDVMRLCMHVNLHYDLHSEPHQFTA